MCVAAALLLSTGAARADSPPQITVRAGATQVEVGEAFTVELKALVEQGSPTPTDPDLHPPPGFDVEGPSISSQTIINGFGMGAQIRTGIGAVWRLAAKKPGHYTLGPATVTWAGKRYPGTAVQIDVVAASGRPRQRASNNPFLMPGGPGFNFPWPFQQDFGPPEPQEDDTRTSPELGLTTAPDPVVFVRALADKKSAVIGEQVTVTFYIYHSENLHLVGRREAPFADFVRQALVKDPSHEPTRYAMAGGRRYRVELLDKVALFPLKAGDLATGSIRLTFTTERGRRLGDRDSDDLVIRVTEPPRAGRPAGYVLGDVGKFSLAADVQPRRIEQGGSVAVRVTVTGTGNLPQSLKVPERTGVAWLDPEKKESIEPQGDVLTGSRSFGYVVNVKESGQVDLGELRLPFWDPAAKAYQVATARLGVVDVKPTAPVVDPVTHQPQPADEAPRADPFVGMPGPRATLGAYAPPRPRLFDGSSLWFLVAAPPLLVGVFSAGSSAVRRARQRRAESSSSPAALAQKALADAAEAEARGDVKALCGALERAAHLAIEGATGLKSRGVQIADLPAELGALGLPAELGDTAAGVLRTAETLRFEPDPDPAGARDLVARTRALVADLGRRR